jgi:hypothetical protein
MLNSKEFTTILKAYGYPVSQGRFVFTKDLDIEYLKSRIAIDKELAQLIPFPKSYWHDTYGIPLDN